MGPGRVIICPVGGSGAEGLELQTHDVVIPGLPVGGSWLSVDLLGTVNSSKVLAELMLVRAAGTALVGVPQGTVASVVRVPGSSSVVRVSVQELNWWLMEEISETAVAFGVVAGELMEVVA